MADLVRGPVELMDAVRRLVRDMVVVGTLEDAEDLVAVHPELTAVTAEGDILSAHFAHGGSAGAPSLLEVQASVDEAAAQLEELAVRCAGLTEEQRLAGSGAGPPPGWSRSWGSGAGRPSGRSPGCPSNWGGWPGRPVARPVRPSG